LKACTKHNVSERYPTLSQSVKPRVIPGLTVLSDKAGFDFVASAIYLSSTMNGKTPMSEETSEAEQLINLARTRFSNLTESEFKLLHSVTTGDVARCGHPTDDNQNNPESADSWGPERGIRAELIRWLCVNRDAANLIDPRGILIYAARIDGALDLSFASIGLRLHFARCRITDRINLRFAQLDGLAMNGSVTTGIDGDGLTVRGDVNLRNGFCARGEVRLLGADVGGNLDCSGGQFTNPNEDALSADGASVKGNVFLRHGFNAEGGVRLPGADIGGDLACNGGKLQNPGRRALIADRAKVKGGVFLSGGFSAEGEVRLLGADIEASLDCSEGTFANPGGHALSVDRTKVKGDVFLRHQFSAQGEVTMIGADVGGVLNCGGGMFSNPGKYAFSADGARIKRSVVMRDGCTTKGGIRLVGVDVGGVLEITDAKFSEGSSIDAERAHVNGGLFWRGMPETPVVLDLNHASVGPIADDGELSWPKQGNLNLDGFVYSRFGDGPKDATSRLEWLGRQQAGQFTPQPFQQLAKVLREDGDNFGAARVLFAMEDQRRKYGKLGLLTWLWLCFLRVLTGYGYRPLYPLLWGIPIVVLGSVLFWTGYHHGAITPTDKDAYEVFESLHPRACADADPPCYYVEFSAPVYSLETFTPIVDLGLGQKEHWMPNPHQGSWGEFLRVYLWIHIGLGLLLTALSVKALASILGSG